MPERMQTTMRSLFESIMTIADRGGRWVDSSGIELEGGTEHEPPEGYRNGDALVMDAEDAPDLAFWELYGAAEFLEAMEGIKSYAQTGLDILGIAERSSAGKERADER